VVLGNIDVLSSSLVISNSALNVAGGVAISSTGSLAIDNISTSYVNGTSLFYSSLLFLLLLLFVLIPMTT